MINIKIDKKSGKPLYVQIRDRIVQAIQDRELNPGDRLPSVAAFAKNIGVTQATIRRALEDLGKQGLTKCHVGRGTFVAEFDFRDAGAPNPYNQNFRENSHRFPGGQAKPAVRCAAQRLRKGISKGLCDLMAIAKHPEIAGFAKGVPDPGLHDPGFFENIVTMALKENPSVYMAYEDCQGLLELRREIASQYSRKGVHISPDQVLITNGSQQGASIAALDAADKKRHVICESPCFQGIPDTFVAHGNWVDTLMTDGKDSLDELNTYAGKESSLLYLCPDFRNPTGTDMTPERRESVVAWARANNGIILSDEIFQDLRFEGKQEESIFNLLGGEQTIIISSLSKSLMSGLRVGWMISSPRRIARFSRIKRLMDQACPPLMQGVVLKLFQSGTYGVHLEKIRKIYRDRRDVMLDCLEQVMPDSVTWTRPQGGFALWVTLPRGYSSVALLISAIDKGINFLPGPLFDIDQRFVNSFRLSWAWSGPDEILEGIEILADTVKELLRQSPGDSGMSGLIHFQ
ncbi:MAG: PLP-dependent aminotransferase family protein [Desulfobacteraceae bacterium]|nr:PLP-dependent aminotransferase family protein [Desulfobacteraceae bacterium]